MTDNATSLLLRPGVWRRQRGVRRVHFYRTGTIPISVTPVCGARINYARTQRAGDLAYRSPDACYECLASAVSLLASARAADEKSSSRAPDDRDEA
jgi:hypothetical protein